MKAISVPVASFVANLARLRLMLNLPAETVWSAMAFQKAVSIAEVEVLGVMGAAATSEQSALIGKRTYEIFCERWPKDGREMASEVARLEAGLFGKVFSGRQWLGLEANLTGQITGAWTAFEVLAGDLWEAAINFHPDTLSLLKGPKGKGGSKAKADEESKSIQIGYLAKHSYDLSQKMGTLLRDKCKWIGIAEIREAYWMAFDGGDVCDSIDVKCLDNLASLRNVLVHRAGKVDEKFKRELSGIAMLRKLKENELVPVDGELIKQVLPPAIEACKRLVSAVDDWLVDNKPKDPSHGN